MLDIGEQIGNGSSGEVFKGSWRGIEVGNYFFVPILKILAIKKIKILNLESGHLKEF